MIVAWITRALKNTRAGRGVPRMRFSTPPSRANTICRATFVKQAEIRPNAPIAAT